MDATAQLALMTKAKVVFEQPGMFLSFPALTPISFSPSVLDFGKALADPKVSAALLEFSRLANQCPGGVIFHGDSDQYLWDHYDQWLSTMDLAQDGLSADQGAAYAEATALLRALDANGLSVDSPALAIYKQCRDQYLAAEQTYKSAQIAASVTQDTTAKAKWQSTDEPRLRQAVAASMADWSEKGKKATIEAAQAEVSAYEARLPRKAWMAWRSAYNPDLDLFTDAASNASCGPSGFAPADIIAGTWPTFTLTADEIHGLAAQAPKELQAIFGETGTSAIASLSFEFRSAAVVRTWFNAASFDSRFWKFDGGLPDLSDGNTPPKGAWPAYVTAVVFARNIRVTTVGAPQSPPQPIHTIPPAVFRPEVLRMLQTQKPMPTMQPRMMMMARPVMGAPAVARAVTISPAALHPAIAVSGAPSPALRTAMVNPALRLNAAVYRTSPVVQAPPAVAPPASTASAQQPDDQVSILAFICRSLPRVPNPDPALHW